MKKKEKKLKIVVTDDFVRSYLPYSGKVVIKDDCVILSPRLSDLNMFTGVELLDIYEFTKFFNLKYYISSDSDNKLFACIYK